MGEYYVRISRIADLMGFKSVNAFAIEGLKYKSSEKLNRLKKDGTKPSADIIEDITNLFERINVRWLLTGKGGELIQSDEQLTFIDDIELAEHVFENIEFYSKKLHWNRILTYGKKIDQESDMEKRIKALEDKLNIKTE